MAAVKGSTISLSGGDVAEELTVAVTAGRNPNDNVSRGLALGVLVPCEFACERERQRA